MGCRTYGGHGEQMAVFASTAKVQGIPLTDLIGTEALNDEQWSDIRQRVCQGGKRIIQLRGTELLPESFASILVHHPKCHLR